MRDEGGEHLSESKKKKKFSKFVLHSQLAKLTLYADLFARELKNKCFSSNFHLHSVLATTSFTANSQEIRGIKNDFFYQKDEKREEKRGQLSTGVKQFHFRYVALFNA